MNDENCPGGKAFRDEFDSRLVHQGPGALALADEALGYELFMYAYQFDVLYEPSR